MSSRNEWKAVYVTPAGRWSSYTTISDSQVDLSRRVLMADWTKVIDLPRLVVFAWTGPRPTEIQHTIYIREDLLL
jgi:hypothetical protein